MIGKAIKRLREGKEITRTLLSEKTGISLPSITQYENGNRNPSDENLEKIAEVLDTSVDSLKELAVNIENSLIKDPLTNDYQYKRRVELIMRHNDVVIELRENVLMALNIRIHDLLDELSSQRVGMRQRTPSALEAILDRVLREIYTENIDEIAYRVSQELERTNESLDDFIREINEHKYRY